MTPLPTVTLGSTEPLYNIGVVSRMTGVSMATLRAWERRYDFPESQRTAGGHRLYSEKDIMRLRWVKERIDEGMQTSQAINALYHQESTGKLTLIEFLPSAVEPERKEAVGSHLTRSRDLLVAALLNQDLAKADDILGDALAVSTPEDLILDVISPAFSDIGESWEKGKISIASEHLGTNYLRQKLLMWMISGPPPKAVNPIILACAPNEWHEGGLLVLGALLKRRRWPVVYLGQAVPLHDLAELTQKTKPSVIVLIAELESSAAHLVNWQDFLPEAAERGKPVITYAGRIFVTQPAWRERVPGAYLGDDFRIGLNTLERLLVQST